MIDRVRPTIRVALILLASTLFLVHAAAAEVPGQWDYNKVKNNIQSNDQGAGDAAHFLRDGLGARARGMGGAFVAIADGVSASYWNAAGLVQTASVGLEGTYESRFGGLFNLQYVTGCFSSPTIGVGGAWLHSEPYSVYLLSVAGKLGNLSLGLTGKVYDFSANGEGAHGSGIDVGSLFRVSLSQSELVFGLTSTDIGWSRIDWQAGGQTATDRVAWVTRLGSTLKGLFPSGEWQCALDLELALPRPPRQGEDDYFSKTLEIDLALGGEVWFDWIAFRAGLANISLGEDGGLSLSPSLGLSVKTEEIGLHIAWAPSLLGQTYLLSVEFRL